MAEEYTCIECENLYDNKDGDTDERMCRKCLDRIYDEDRNLVKGERRNPNIRRSSTTHYPDWNKKNKEYVVPPNKRKIDEMNDAIKLTPEYKLGKKLLNNEISNLTTKNIIDNDKEEGTDVE